MQKQSNSWVPTICLILFVAVFLLVGQVSAQNKIAGTMTMAYTQVDSMVVGDAAGHNLSLARAEGTNTSAGETSFMDGAATINFSYSDLLTGSGPNQGYVILKNGDDMAMSKWEGKVTTTMSDEGTPIINFDGTFEFVSGTGKYQGISGNGTYKGQFTSMTEYTTDWEGQYTLK